MYNDAMLLLASVQWMGALYTAVLLFLCFILVHIFKLAGLGLRASKNLPLEKQEPPPPEPEPVYYIVEKKKKRAKAEYSEPKRISFK